MVSRETVSGGRGTPGDYSQAGRWLRDLRRHWQLTQTELAEQAGIPDPAIIDWMKAFMRNETPPPVEYRRLEWT